MTQTPWFDLVPRGSGHAVVVFTLLPDQPDFDLTRLAAGLSGAERAQAARFAFARDRQSYLAAHALLQRCASVASGRTQCEILGGGHRKPELVPSFGVPALKLSLTHTRGLVACGMAYGHAIGVDAELLDTSVDVEALAECCFALGEQRTLHAAAPAARLGRFFELWTLKEAVTKADGRGLAMGPRSFSVAMDEPPVVHFGASENTGSETGAAWQLARYALPEHRMAVALRRDGTAWPVRMFWHKVAFADLLPACDDVAGPANTGGFCDHD